MRIDGSNFIKKFFAFSIGSWISLVLGFISAPLITRLVLPEEYGIFSMFNLVTNVFSVILILGLDQSFVRFYYEEQSESRPTLLRYCLRLPLVLTIIISLVSLVFWKKLSIMLFDEETFIGMFLTIICSIIMLFNRYALLVVRMQQKGKLFSYLQILQKVGYIILTLVFYLMSLRGFYILAAATTFSLLHVTLKAIQTERKFWFSRDAVETKNEYKTILRYGIPLVITFLVTWLFQSIDRIAIKKWCSYTELGIYSSAFTIISILNVLQTSFTTFWTPVAFERYEKDKHDLKFFEIISSIVAVIMFILANIVILSRDLIVMLLGYKYRSAAYIMPFLVFMPLMSTISETTVIGINFKKKPKYHLWISLVACIVNIIGNIILVPIIGGRGSAISTGLSYIIFYYMRTLISRKLYNVRYYLRRISIINISIILYALYATFVSFSYVYVLWGVINIIIILLLYKRKIKALFGSLNKGIIQ